MSSKGKKLWVQFTCPQFHLYFFFYITNYFLIFKNFSLRVFQIYSRKASGAFLFARIYVYVSFCLSLNPDHTIETCNLLHTLPWIIPEDIFCFRKSDPEGCKFRKTFVWRDLCIFLWLPYFSFVWIYSPPHF